MKNHPLFYILFLIAFVAMFSGGIYKWMDLPDSDWMSLVISLPGFITFFYLFLRLKRVE